jgi:hypothetical protein
MFKIVYTKLVQWLIPAWLRMPTLTLLVLAANKPLREAYDGFSNYRQLVVYKLAHNGQVCYLQKVLNDAFDNTARRIQVVDFTVFGALFFYDENDQVMFIGDEQEVFFYDDDTGFDFTIRIPATLTSNTGMLAAIKAKANEYKLDGKNYYVELI